MIKAALGSTLFFFAAPCVVAGLIPWWISGWDDPRFWPAALVIIAGILIVVRAFIRFVREGHGTPAPLAPTEHLVIGGDFRYVRNPMYVGVVAIILGQALLFLNLPLLAYAAVAWVVMATFVRSYEEPVLRQRYAAQYEEYRKAVPAWIPRMRPRRRIDG
jgi:protein-S-isoprenylcysteine O-methyltransferase Ste14